MTLAPEQALAVALANLERLHGAPAARPWHNLQSVNGRSADYDSSYFLDRAFWRRLLVAHPQGLALSQFAGRATTRSPRRGMRTTALPSAARARN